MKWMNVLNFIVDSLIAELKILFYRFETLLLIVAMIVFLFFTGKALYDYMRIQSAVTLRTIVLIGILHVVAIGLMFLDMRTDPDKRKKRSGKGRG